jgi:hypothetical protein
MDPPEMDPPTTDLPSTDTPDTESTPVVPIPGRTGAAGAIAVILTVLGLGVHIGVLVTRGLAAGRVPWGNK